MKSDSMRPQKTDNPLSTGPFKSNLSMDGFDHEKVSARLSKSLFDKNEGGWQTVCKLMAHGWQMVGHLLRAQKPSTFSVLSVFLPFTSKYH